MWRLPPSLVEKKKKKKKREEEREEGSQEEQARARAPRNDFLWCPIGGAERGQIDFSATCCAAEPFPVFGSDSRGKKKKERRNEVWRGRQPLPSQMYLLALAHLIIRKKKKKKKKGEEGRKEGRSSSPGDCRPQRLQESFAKREKKEEGGGESDDRVPLYAVIGKHAQKRRGRGEARRPFGGLESCLKRKGKERGGESARIESAIKPPNTQRKEKKGGNGKKK